MTRPPAQYGLPALRESDRFIAAIEDGEVVIDMVDDVPAVWLDERTPGRYERFVKPVVDRVGAVALLIVLSPVMLACALAVRATLGPGVIFRQTRVGRDGEHFDVLKFRTMHPDRRAGHSRRPGGPERRRTHKTQADPRHTRLGSFLRATSLDELPQLWNVVRGEMSLVGPRPELVGIVDQYADWQHRRHDVRPGLTGLWQVSERDVEGNMHLHVAIDLVYVRELSALTDLRLLLLTIPAVLGRPVAKRTERTAPSRRTAGTSAAA
jgi:lipopolysaccharide/colanic/teichoic acid biosynthesis glycosyltransferase